MHVGLAMEKDYVEVVTNEVLEKKNIKNFFLIAEYILDIYFNENL